MTQAVDKHTLFISDLHLCEERPRANEIFFRFAREIAPGAEALYILGDLFEYWVGDDDVNDQLAAKVADALTNLSNQGVAVYLMQGNRDVMMGDDYARRCGATLIADPTVIDLYGTRTLLMHGDTLCTDDLEYQKFRAYIRSPKTQAQLLALPLAARHAKAKSFRAESETSKEGKAPEIMDVAQQSVIAAIQQHQVTRLIHGHTHRPACHKFMVSGSACERWVLSDWYVDGEYVSFGRSPIATRTALDVA